MGLLSQGRIRFFLAVILILSVLGTGVAIVAADTGEGTESTATPEGQSNDETENDSQFVQPRDGDPFKIWNRDFFSPLEINRVNPEPEPALTFSHAEVLGDVNGRVAPLDRDRQTIWNAETGAATVIFGNPSAPVYASQFEGKDLELIVAKTDILTGRSGTQSDQVFDILAGSSEATYESHEIVSNYTEPHAFDPYEFQTDDNYIFFLTQRGEFDAANGEWETNSNNRVYGVDIAFVQQKSSTIGTDGGTVTAGKPINFSVSKPAAFGDNSVHTVFVLKETKYINEDVTLEFNNLSDVSDLDNFAARTSIQAMRGETRIEQKYRFLGQPVAKEQASGEQPPRPIISPILGLFDIGQLTNNTNGRVIDASRVAVQNPDGRVQVGTSPYWKGEFDVLHYVEDQDTGSLATDRTTVNVDEPNIDFDIAIQNSNDPIVAGEGTLEVDAKITNADDIEWTEEFELIIGEPGSAEGVDTKTLTLEPDESRTVTFTHQPEATRFGSSIPIGVESETATDSKRVEILAPSKFQVDIADITRSSERVSVQADITNPSPADGTRTQDTQDVTATSTGPNINSATEEVTLADGESKTVRFTTDEITDDHAPRFSIDIASEDDSEKIPVPVNRPYLYTTIDDTKIQNGNQANLTVSIYNTGGSTGDQQITVESQEIPGGYQESRRMTIPSGRSFSTNFTTPQINQTGDYKVSVNSGDHRDTAIITVDKGSLFDVSLDGPQAVVRGEPASLELSVQNLGKKKDTQDIEILSTGPEGFESPIRDVTLASGDNRRFNIDTAETTKEDTPAFDITAESNDDQDTLTVDVKDGKFDIEITDINKTVVAGETVKLTAKIKNIFTEEDTQNITFDIDGVQQDAEEVTLAPEEQKNLKFQYSTTNDDPPGIDLAVSTERNEVAQAVSVKEPAEFALALDEDSTDGTVPEGEAADVVVDVTNNGDVSGTETIEITVDGTEIEASPVNISVNGKQTKSERIKIDTDKIGAQEGDELNVNIKGTKTDDSITTDIVVEESLDDPFFNVSVDSQENAYVNEALQFDVQVNNLGDKPDTQNIDIEIIDGPEIEGKQSVTEEISLSANNGTTRTFETAPVSEADGPRFDVEARSANDTDQVTLPVKQDAEFNVDISNINDPVEAGERLEVEAVVENAGDQTGEKTVQIQVDNENAASERLTLSPGEKDTINLTYETAESDPSNVDVTVISPDDTTTQSATILQPATFSITDITASDRKVEAGEEVNIAATIANTGDVNGTQTIAFSIDGSITERASNVELQAGEEKSVSFSYTTQQEDEPGVTATVSTEDASNSVEVSVGTGPFFEVDVAAPDRVVVGETFEFDVRISNVGDFADTQNVKIKVVDGPKINSQQMVTEEISLSGNSNTTRTFQPESVSESDQPEFDIEAGSDNETDIQTLSVDEGAEFDVNISEINDPVVAGENLIINTTVTNIGDQTAEKPITLQIDNEQQQTQLVELSPGAEKEVTLGYQTAVDDPESIAITVESPDNDATETATVLEPATFEVASITASDTEVEAGEEISVAATIANTGDVNGTQTIAFSIDGSIIKRASNVELRAGEKRSVSFSYATGERDIPDVRAAVQTGDDSRVTNIDINRPPAFLINISSLNDQVVAGNGTITANATIKNVGDSRGSKNIEFKINGERVEDISLTLDSAETITQTFEYATQTGDNPSVEVVIESEDDDARADARVLKPAEYAVNIIETNEPVVEGEDLELTAKVVNKGEARGDTTVELFINGSSSSVTTVSLGPDERVNKVLTYSTTQGDAPSLNAQVATGSNVDNTLVDVIQPAAFELALSEEITDKTVIENRTAELGINLQNTGGEPGTETLEIRADNDNIKAKTVEVDPGVTKLAVVEFDTESLDIVAGDEINVEIRGRSSGDTISQTIAVTEPPKAAVFDVTVDAPESINEGQTAAIDVIVENVGDLSGTQNIEVATQNGPNIANMDDMNLTLESGETDTLTFETDPATGAYAPMFQVTAESANDSSVNPIDIKSVAAFDVKITDTNQPTPGEGLRVNTTIENTGDIKGSQTVTLALNGTVVTKRLVSLAGGGNKDVTFTADTGTSDLPALEATVSSNDSTATEVVALSEPPSFGVEITDIEETVAAGDELVFDVRVQNNADRPDTQVVEVSIQSASQSNTTEFIDSIATELDPGGEKTHTMRYNTTGQTGRLIVRASTKDDAANVTTEVIDQPPGSVLIDIDHTASDSEVEVGETAEIVANVTNTGQSTVVRNISLITNQTTLDTQQIEIDPTDAETVSFDIEAATAGELNIEAITQYDTDDYNLIVEDSDPISAGGGGGGGSNDSPTDADPEVGSPQSGNASFEIAAISPDMTEVTDSKNVSVTVQVSNTGDAKGTKTVDIRLGDEKVLTKEVTLAAGESQELSYTINATDTGSDLSLSATTENETMVDSVTITETEPATPGVTETETPVNTTDQREEREEMAGFEVAVAIVALIATALLAARTADN